MTEDKDSAVTDPHGPGARAHEPGPGDRAHEPGTELVQVLPGLARFAVGAGLRTALWGIETSLKVVRGAISVEEAGRMLQQFGSGLRAYARELLGIQDLDNRVRELMPGPASRMRAAARAEASNSHSLREQGADLLRQSADVAAEDGTHPAYARILSELAPDEARILRLLAVEGPQPTIDVRAANLIGVGSQLIAQGLNLIGAEAGCRHPDRTALYLNNLDRLGLVCVPRDPIDNPMRYQVLEAQPDAMRAIRQAGRAKTVHRSVRLTTFGQDFCQVCLPFGDADIEALSSST
jgi:hypothetical protein